MKARASGSAVVFGMMSTKPITVETRKKIPTTASTPRMPSINSLLSLSLNRKNTMEAPIITSARKISLDTERGFALRSTSAAGFAAAGFVSVMNRSFAPPRIRPV